MNNSKSSLLFADPSFTSGIAKLLYVGSTLDVYNSSDSPEHADYNALRADWKSVEEDIGNETRKVRKELASC